MSVLTKGLVLTLLPLAFGSPLLAPKSLAKTIHKRLGSFVWASVGDSWASGVSFDGEKTDYDGDQHGCHRWKDSYGPVMERDQTWTLNAQEFHFPACSGSLLVNIYKEPQGDIADQNPPQMDQVGSPQMITYHSGGNNCLFGFVVRDCIYQPDPVFNYGPEYPDPAGQCFQALQKSNKYIDSPSTDATLGLYIDEMNTVRDLLSHKAVRDNRDFRLYILSYVEFFNLGENWCDKSSFGVGYGRIGHQPKLTNRLRTDLNDAVARVNRILARVAAGVGDPRVTYVDLNAAFAGHRFCEDGSSWQADYRNPDVWLWNANPPSLDPPAGADAGANDSALAAWLEAGQIPGSLPFLGGPTMGVEQQGGPETQSGGAGAAWQQRPFHPKQGGTQAIANIIIAQAKADRIPGVVGSSPATSGACVCDESGCSPESPPCCASGTC